MHPDPLELLTIEREIRELATSAEAFAKARAECARTIDSARAVADEIAPRVHELEEAARERRRERSEIVSGRVELERELNEALEAESMATARRAQFEQRAAGLRAAEAFAASNRADAELKEDLERAERETVTARRADHEARLSEEHAKQALGDEQRAAAMRKALEERVDAIREQEDALNRRRDAAERAVADARDELERARSDVDRALAEAQRLDAEIASYVEKRRQTETRLRGARSDAKERLEARLAELQATEVSLQRQREEIERLIAVVDAEGPIDAPLDFSLLEPVAPSAPFARKTPPKKSAPSKPHPAKPAKAKPATAKPGGDGAGAKTPAGGIDVGLARMLVNTFFPRRDKPGGTK